MKPPKCRICGTGEWSHVCSGQPSAWGGTPPESHPASHVKDDPPVPNSDDAVPNKPTDVERAKQWKADNRKRYRAYMKAYMARRRSQGPRIAQDARVDRQR